MEEIFRENHFSTDQIEITTAEKTMKQYQLKLKLSNI